MQIQLFYLSVSKDWFLECVCWDLLPPTFDFNSEPVKPTKKSYDYRNKVEHHNRILLEAEPQIGKTGVYLSVSTNRLVGCDRPSVLKSSSPL